MSWPERGEVWLVDLGYAAKTRPGLVISVPIEDRDRVLVTLIPHTTSRQGSRFEVEISKSFLKTGAFLAQNLVTVPRVKLLKRLGSLTSDEFADVEASVRLWLGLPS